MRGGTECLAPGPLGHIGIMGTHIIEQCTVLGNVYYRQQLNSGRCGFLVGRFDPNDFMDVLGYANPWTTFSNVAVLLNTTIALPDWS